jgi:hypothetical protein
MPPFDPKKELKHLYNPSAREVSVVEVPPLNFLMVDGQGDPQTSPEFAAAFEVLYPVAYTLKFTLKKLGGFEDYVVGPPEALWWVEDGNYASFAERRDEWRWTVMLLQPEWITAELVATAKEEVARKKKGPAGLERVRFERFTEGPAVQIMHLGPYSEETENIAKLHANIAELGGQPVGKHHEIYLSDSRRVTPEKMKTVVRQPYAT